jgi:Fic family protein
LARRYPLFIGVMAGGKTRVRPTSYRDAQNVIRDSRNKAIVYLPPEAKDVAPLMQQLVAWISATNQLPVPLRAAIAHYQYAAVHPYYDGNGRTARLLTTLILHPGGYGLKGLYALDEYYARDLKGYYEVLTIGPSHNYYMGRVEADITPWVAYFIEGMATSFERVLQQAKLEAESGRTDQSPLLRNLDSRQRKVLVLFERSREVTAAEIAALFGLRPRSSTSLCQRWARVRFLLIADPAKKSRRYRLADEYEQWITRAT